MQHMHVCRLAGAASLLAWLVAQGQVKAEPDTIRWQGKVLSNGQLHESDSESEESEGGALTYA